MPNLLCRSVIPYLSGIPADVVVNDFSVIVPDVGEPTLAEMAEVITNFFNQNVGADNLATFMHPFLDRTSPGNSRIEIYAVNLVTGDIGSPLGVENWRLVGTPNENGLPQEVALCTSWAASPLDGTAPGRRKGRIYLGPFTHEICTAGADQPTRPDESFLDLVIGATSRLAQDFVTLGCRLAVWSRADAAYYPVVRGWVDNEFDTQRRRGLDASARENWTLILP